MTDREFYIEIRHAVIIIIRAMMRRYGLTWLDFFPPDAITATPMVSWTVTVQEQTGVK